METNMNNMKKISVVSVLLTSALSLTACGGGSSDSSGSNQSVSNNPAPSNSTPIPSPTVQPCTVEGSNIYGKAGTSCTFSLPNLNSGQTQTLVCNATSGGSFANGSMIFGTAYSLNGTTISCK